MAAKRRGDEPSRSGFIRDQLGKNPKLSLKELIEAWKGGGNTGTITPTLFYQVRSKLGLAQGQPEIDIDASLRALEIESRRA